MRCGSDERRRVGAVVLQAGHALRIPAARRLGVCDERRQGNAPQLRVNLCGQGGFQCCKVSGICTPCAGLKRCDCRGHDLGVQQAGEPGIANMDVWTEDGMVATTDSSGKFSFVNVRPGRHAFRLDPRSVPNGYAVAGQDIQLVDASGWTTPRVDFRVRATNPVAATPPPEAPEAPAAARRVQSRGHRTSVPFTFAAVRLRAPRDSQLLFEHVLPKPHLAQVRYELTVQQPREYTVDAIVAFSPQADSAVVYVDGKLFTQYSWLEHRGNPIPFAHPDARIRIVAWSSARRDSASVRVVAWPPYDSANATVRRYLERAETIVSAAVRDSLSPQTAMLSVPGVSGRAPAVAAVNDSVPAAVPVPPVPVVDSAALSRAQDETAQVARAMAQQLVDRFIPA